MNIRPDLFLGLDLGSVSVDLVVMDRSGRLLESRYVRIHGQPIATVLALLTELDARHPLDSFAGVALTGSGGALVERLAGGALVNELVAQARAAAAYHPEARAIIDLGGEDAKLLLLESGPQDRPALADFAMNTMCAAGTGSFLDQQAARLGLTIEEFGRLAAAAPHIPRIAGRCTVFAKSDMIHLQQIGTPVDEIVAGLCWAVARNFKSSIGRGKKIGRPVLFQGGVAANQGMVRAFADILELGAGELIVPEHFFFMGAIGAVLTVLDENKPLPQFRGLPALRNTTAPAPGSHQRHPPLPPQPPLSPEHSAVVPLPAAPFGVYLGIDIGSLSTNVVAIDESGRVLARQYLRTAGRPIEAVRQGLRAVQAGLGDHATVLGVGTTGSGRHMIGDLVGADIVRNEITAQAAAAVHYDPQVDTIFEIGGQDSKYISLTSGAVVDFEMNKVCAAGTGSFLEEQAEKLSVRIEAEFSRLAFASARPDPLGERCTVFIESDLVACQARGSKQEDLCAGLAYSIVLNYLNKVMARRRVGKRVFFQGGVAWNQAVVAAFAQLTGTTITVPPHHDVTGAIGVALLAHKERTWERSSFKGFAVTERPYTLETFDCRQCANLCQIRTVKMEGEKPLTYGGRCEKYEVARKKAQDPGIDYFALRDELVFGRYQAMAPPDDKRPTVGIPRVLSTYDLFPYWHAFFETLGYRVVLSAPTNQAVVHASLESVLAETCFPVKIVHGHVLDLLKQNVDAIFLPSIITLPRDHHQVENTYLCPYVQAAPYIVRPALEHACARTAVWSPPFRFGRSKKQVMADFYAFGRTLGKSRAEIGRAVQAAETAQHEVVRRFREIGHDFLKNLKGRALVLVSRPYNGCDPGLNLNLPRRLRDLGVQILPLDFLPLDDVDISDEHENMYWKYGHKILRAAEFIRRDQRLFAVYLSNFACGPDSFISHYVQEKMAGKPYLAIEIDEHNADAGVITRCEAFLDSLAHAVPPPSIPAPRRAKISHIFSKTIYIPYMSDHAFALSAAFRAFGTRAEVLPPSDDRSLELGRKHSSGRECFPFIITCGDILRQVTTPGFDAKQSAFFMPAANGPCRFGQYHKMHRTILEQLGYHDVEVLSPNSKYSYNNMLSTQFRNRAWRGILAIEVLEKALRKLRPYELEPGSIDRAYQGALRELENAIADRNMSISGALSRVKHRLAAIPVDRSVPKPVVGVVGEIFLRSHAFSNSDIVRKIEALGGEVWVAPFTEWIFYTNYRFKEDSLVYRNFSGYLKMSLQDRIQKAQEEFYAGKLDGLDLDFDEAPTAELIAHSRPYIHKSFGGEAILSVGKAIDYVRQGVAGIVNVMPFTCMYGTIVVAVSKKLREDFGDVPWLNAAFDGQEDTNLGTRLEAFMHQAKAYKGKAGKGIS